MTGGQIHVQHLSKTYVTADGAIEALQDATFSVRGGEFVSLLGPSGCGKSTLLMLVAGLLEPTSGQVLLDGRTVDRPQTNVGVVFQEPVLLDWRRAVDNVMLQIEGRKLPREVYRPRALELLRRVGLAGFERAYPYELSGGMRQRVSICRALIHDPPLLVMDEPFGALDALTRDQAMVDLQQIWSANRKTVLFVTHHIPEAVFLSDQVVVMTPRPGRVERIMRIELPRPRRLGMRATPEFGTYVQDILTIFKAHGILVEDESGSEPVSGLGVRGTTAK
jgi:NitT/TauT family transport system ATP-binding protein